RGQLEAIVAKVSASFYVAYLPRWDGYCYIGAMAHALGYARVSTGDQDARLQHDALQAAGCYRIFTDTASGSLQSRPELDKLMDQLRPGDTLVVWRLDRLGRSIRHLIDHLSDLQARGFEFRSMPENIDKSSPGGGLVFDILASLSEFDSELFRQRPLVGLSRD